MRIKSKKIPVLRIIGDVFIAPFKFSGILIKKLLLPLGILFALMHGGIEYVFVPSLFIAVLMSIPFTMLAVNCHRTFLLEGDEQAKVVFFSQREWRFLGWVILLGLLGLIADKASTALAEVMTSAKWHAELVSVIAWSIFLIPTYFLSRWCLVYPATATDKRFSFTESWHLSAGNSIRLFVVIGIFPIVMYESLSWIFYYELFEIRLFAKSPHAIAAISAIAFISVAILEIAAISLSYKALLEAKPQEDFSKGFEDD